MQQQKPEWTWMSKQSPASTRSTRTNSSNSTWSNIVVVATLHWSCISVFLCRHRYRSQSQLCPICISFIIYKYRWEPRGFESQSRTNQLQRHRQRNGKTSLIDPLIFPGLNIVSLPCGVIVITFSDSFVPVSGRPSRASAPFIRPLAGISPIWLIYRHGMIYSRCLQGIS